MILEKLTPEENREMMKGIRSKLRKIVSENYCEYSNNPINSQDEECSGCNLSKTAMENCPIYKLNKHYQN